MLNSDSPITEDFLRNNLEAAIYLASNPSMVASLNISDDRAEAFQDDFNQNLDTYKSTIITKAKESIDFAAVYSDDFLETNYDLARLVVANDLAGGDNTLGEYLHQNWREVETDFRTSDFTRAHEADREAFAALFEAALNTSWEDQGRNEYQGPPLPPAQDKVNGCLP